MTVKRFDVTLEVDTSDPTQALEEAQTEWKNCFLESMYIDEDYTLIDYNIQFYGDNHEVYLSYRVKEE